MKHMIQSAKERNWNEAILSGEKLCSLDATNKEFVAWLGYCHLESGDWKQGQELLNSSVFFNIKATVPRAAYLRGLIYNDTPDARKIYAKLAAVDPEIGRRFLSIDDPNPVARAYAKAVMRFETEERPSMFVFYHLPFTGGTSLQCALSRAFPLASHFNIKRRSGLRLIHEFMTLSQENLKEIRYLHLHHPYPLDIRGVTFKYFTILRDPVSYFLSGYYKRRNLGNKIMPSRDMLVDKGGLEQSIEFAKKHHLHNGLTRQLAVLHPRFKETFAQKYAANRRSLSRLITGRKPRNPHLARVHYEEDLLYGTATADLSETDLLEIAEEVLETFFYPPGMLKYMDASFLTVMARLGMKVTPKIPHLGVSARPSLLSISQSIKDTLGELNQADQILYDRNLAAFERDNADLIKASRAGATPDFSQVSPDDDGQTTATT